MRDFLDEIMASGGSWRFVVSKGVGDQRPKHHPVRSVDEALYQVNRRGLDRDWWFTPASFSVDKTFKPDGEWEGWGRKSHLATHCRALWLDIDVKPGEPDCYQTHAEVAAALQDFLAAAGLPQPTWLVATGHGLHVWWVLDRELAAADWLQLAARFKACVIRHALRCDRQVIEVARMMRVPGTWNWKDRPTGHRITARRIAGRASLAAMEQALAAYPAKPLRSAPAASAGLPAASLAVLGQAPVIQGDLTSAQDLQQGVAEVRTPADFLLLARRCKVALHVYANGGAGLDEPAWKTTLNIALACENSRTHAHDLSKGHADYDPAATDAKLDIQARVPMGAPLCASIAQHVQFADLCAGCLFRGMIKTPVELGRGAWLDRGWDVDAEGKIYAYDKENGARIQRLGGAMALDFRLEDLDEGTFMNFEFIRNGATRRVSLSTGLLTDKNGFGKRMTGPTGLSDDQELRELSGYLKSWHRKLHGTMRHQGAYSGKLGWVRQDGQDGFNLGDRLIWQDGSESGLSVNWVTRSFGRAGAPLPSLQAVRAILQGPPELWTALAASMAGPLCCLLGAKPAAICLTGPTGAGKSSALETAASFWAKPKQAICMTQDTSNSAINRLGIMNHITMMWDDALATIEKSQDTYTRLIFQTVSGREKSRMGSNAVVAEPVSFNTMVVFTSNDPVRDRVGDHATSQAAAQSRLLPIMVPRPSWATRPTVFGELEENYGHIGYEYAKLLLAQRRMIEKDLKDLMASLVRQVRGPADETRFMLVSATVMIYGLYRLLALLGLDASRYMARFRDMLVGCIAAATDPGTMTRLRRDSTSTQAGLIAILNCFINEHQDRIARTTGDTIGTPTTPMQPQLNRALRTGMVVGHEVDSTAMVWIDRRALRAWVEKQPQLSKSVLFSEMEKSPAFKGYRHGILGANTLGEHQVSGHPADCIRLSLVELRKSFP